VRVNRGVGLDRAISVIHRQSDVTRRLHDGGELDRAAEEHLSVFELARIGERPRTGAKGLVDVRFAHDEFRLLGSIQIRFRGFHQTRPNIASGGHE
jgi:hypothetical protein